MRGTSVLSKTVSSFGSSSGKKSQLLLAQKLAAFEAVCA
jgi:hypothetical protein